MPETAHTGKNQTEDPVLRQRKALFSSLLEQSHVHGSISVKTDLALEQDSRIT
jgi:hypothetical protein